jgi:hypothetical protein
MKLSTTEDAVDTEDYAAPQQGLTSVSSVSPVVENFFA